MAQFKNREEYEKWKAERQKELSRSKEGQTSPPQEGPRQSPKKEPPAGIPASDLSGIGDLFKKSWETYKERIATLLGLYLFSLFFCLFVAGLFIGTGFLGSFAVSGNTGKGLIIGTAGLIGILGAAIVMNWGISALTFAVSDTRIGFREALSRGWQRVCSFVWFFLISGFIIMGGFLLFVIPGILFLVWFAFGQYVLVAEDERGMNALLKSKKYVKGYWPDVFFRLFLLWLASVVIGIIPFIGPLLMIILMPYMMIFVFHLYEEMKSLKGDIGHAASGGEKFRFVGLATLGYLVLPVVIVGALGASLATLPILSFKSFLESAGKNPAVSRVITPVSDKEVEHAYLEYRAAFISGDIPKLKMLVSAEKAKSLEDPNAPMMLEMAKAFAPKEVKIISSSVTGETATLSLSGDDTMTGSAEMRQEEGRWKLTNESWNMKMSTNMPPPLPETVSRPYEYDKYLGWWDGREVGAASDEWKLTLQSGFTVAISGPGEVYYHGEAYVDNNLGIEGNSIRVLPGGAPFDVRISLASNPAYVGKISLGSFKFTGDVLQMCGSEPGLMKRTSDFRSAGGIRCFEFRKSSTPYMPNAGHPAPPQPAAGTGGSSFSKQDPGLSGEAVVVMDGKTESYPLSSGFFSDTRFKDPRRAIVQFQAPAPEHSNARRIEMTLDATKTGNHYADGKMLSENFMGGAIPIGQSTPEGFIASFKWVADGGQVYFPKPSCVVTITSPYTGSASGTFSGEARNCAVHSAGIDHTISSLKFSMKGVSQR